MSENKRGKTYELYSNSALFFFLGIGVIIFWAYLSMPQ